ncbi:hypothetical protein NSND_50619 [Nitrospira sp. ND1]|nr:hypothetical protein NSND_50619 [Nitrospira sp. ND1]
MQVSAEAHSSSRQVESNCQLERLGYRLTMLKRGLIGRH